jgi:small multidrug resistance pump/quaternary ammonium compound-resistance protein SugE
MLTLTCSLTAAACFTGGGLLMKPAAGLSHIWPSVGVFVLFVVGAALLAVAVHRHGEVGPTYLVVVGLETVLAFTLGVAVYHEQLNSTRVVAVMLVLSGTVMLARDGV